MGVGRHGRRWWWPGPCWGVTGSGCVVGGGRRDGSFVIIHRLAIKSRKHKPSSRSQPQNDLVWAPYLYSGFQPLYSCVSPYCLVHKPRGKYPVA